MNGPGLLRYAILCAMFFLSGCAYISPHIKTDAPIVEAKSGNIMPNLEASIAKVDAWRKDTDNHDDWITVTRRSLDVTTFGLVAAIGVHSIHGAAVNAIKNLALSAGLVYTGENLFFSADQAKLYSTASGALQCISNRGVALRAVVRDQSVGASSNLPVEYKELVLSPPSCTPDPITKKAFDAARLARRAAIVAVEQAAQADITSAAKVETAARNVIRELNTQLDATAPSSASILNSAKSAIALAKAFTPATGAALAPAGGPGGGADAMRCRPS